MKKRLPCTILLCLLLTIILSASAVAASSTKTPSASTSKYIQTYALSCYDKIYGYKDEALKNQSGAYIWASSDECRIVAISSNGKAVKISYPLDSGGRNTAWFERDEFTSVDLTKEVKYEKFNSKVTTYKRNYEVNTNEYGYVGKGDKVFILKEDGDTGYTQIVYPISNGRWKMGWAKTKDVKNAIADGTSSEDTQTTTTKSTYYVSTNGADLIVKKSAKNDADTLGAFSCGSKVTVYDISYNSEWARVKYGEKMGYVHSAFLFQRVPSKVYKQTDKEWASYRYGYASPENRSNGIHATIGTSTENSETGGVGGGCGLVSITNAIHYLNNGKFANPKDLADFSIRNGCRYDGGTSGKLARVLCETDDSDYDYSIHFVKNVAYSKSASSTLKEVKGNLSNGQVAILHVDGHFVALVDYDSRTGKYLIMDSCPSPNRNTKATGYRWMSPSTFDGRMAISNDDTGYAIHVFEKE